jgi:hypothetical protein
MAPIEATLEWDSRKGAVSSCRHLQVVASPLLDPPQNGQSFHRKESDVQTVALT